jgi:HEAT repeat protein
MRLSLWLLGAIVIAASSGCTGPGLFERQSWIFGKDPPDDPALLAKIGPTPAQRIELVRSLGKKMDDSPESAEQVSADLAKRIQTEMDPAVRVEIVEALSKSRSPTALAVLRAGLAYPRPDPDVEVRGTICRAWGRIGGDEARTMLAAALAHDVEGDVRIEAAKALGAFKGSGNMQALSAALEDANIAVQSTAMHSMKAVSGQDFGDDARAWREYAQRSPAIDEAPSLASKLWPWR